MAIYKMWRFVNHSYIALIFALVGCYSPPVAPPRQQAPQPPQEHPRFIPPPSVQQIIPPKTSSNALSAPTLKAQPKPSLGLFIDIPKALSGALVIRHEFFKGISPAKEAGIQSGDVIIWIGACEVINTDTYFKCIEKFIPNQRVQIAFNRDGVVKQVWAKLGERY